MKHKITIAIAEDHDLVRDGLLSMLKDYSSIKVSFAVSNGLELMNKLRNKDVDVVLLDIEMPVMSGREALMEIKRIHPEVKVIIVSSFYQEPFIVEFIKLGANAFLPKNTKIDKLIEVIETVNSSGAYFDSEVSLMLAKELSGTNNKLQSDEKVEFTEREIQVIQLLCKNKTSKEIANELHVSPRTIEWYRSKIMRKLDAKNVTSIILYAVENKLI